MGQPSSADLAARCAAIELLAVGRRRRLDRRRHRGRRPGCGIEAFSRQGRPGVLRSGTARASGRPSSRAGGPRLSIAAPPSSRSPTCSRAWPRRGSRCGPAGRARPGAAAGLLRGRRPARPARAPRPSAWRPVPPMPSSRSVTRFIWSPRAAGGRGAVREVVEVILKSQGLWHGLCSDYTVPAI